MNAISVPSPFTPCKQLITFRKRSTSAKMAVLLAFGQYLRRTPSAVKHHFPNRLRRRASRRRLHTVHASLLRHLLFEVEQKENGVCKMLRFLAYLLVIFIILSAARMQILHVAVIAYNGVSSRVRT